MISLAVKFDAEVRAEHSGKSCKERNSWKERT